MSGAVDLHPSGGCSGSGAPRPLRHGLLHRSALPRTAIRRVLEACMARGKAWAKLRVAGMRTSKERVRRLMREHDLQAPPRAGHAHGPKAHDGTITTEAPDVMWGTDMTATVTVAEGAAVVFVAVDHCATVHRAPCRQAREPLRGPGADPPGHPRTLRGHRRRRGPWAAAASRPRVELLADDFQQEVAFFGIESSPSVREPEGNGVAERHPHQALRDDRGLLEFNNEQWMRTTPKPGRATRPPRAGRGGVNTVKPLQEP